MSEETLNKLLKQARNQEPETTLEEINAWISIGASVSIITLILLKLKWLITYKTGIMITTALITIGVTTATIIAFNMSDEKVEENQALNKNEIHLLLSSEEKKNEIVEEQSVFEPAKKEIETPEKESFIFPIIPILPVSSDDINPSIQPNPVIQKAAKASEYGIFTELKISGASDVVIIQGNKCGVRLEGDTYGLSLADVENKNGTLVISTKSNKNKSYDLKFYITVNDLKKIDVSGASTIHTEGTLIQEKLTIKSAGASELHLSLKNETLILNTSGASDVTLKGNCQSFDLDASGATNLEALSFEAQNATIQCSGASDLKLNVKGELSIDVSGASDVKYKGNPSIIKKSVTGVSELKKL